MATAMSLIGPAPFFVGATPSLAFVYSATACEGLAYALTMVSTFARAHTAAIRKGYRDDLNTYIIISGEESTCRFRSKDTLNG